MEVKLSRERDQHGNIVSAAVTINRNGAYERRRFGTEEEAKAFIKRLKKEATENIDQQP